MEPAKNGGLWASGGVILTALIVVIAVMAMVGMGGGAPRSLYAAPHSATAQATTPTAPGRG